MAEYTTRQAAKKFGISMMSLNRYIAAKKIPAPEVKKLGGLKFRVWTEAEIEHVRQLLPTIANGRKTRYQKQGKKNHSKKKRK
jgi:predicted DNA-binding transcriptional regulator AlpA